MKKLLKQTKEKIEKFVFEKESLDELYQKECEKIKKHIVKFFLFSGLFFFILIGALSLMENSLMDYHRQLLFIKVSFVVLLFFSGGIFVLALITCVSELFSKGSSCNIKKKDVEVAKLKKTELSLQEIEEIEPLLKEIKGSLSDRNFLNLMKTVEIRTNKKYGNAYYFIYLINNYDKIIRMVNLEEKEEEEELRTQFSSFLEVSKVNPNNG